LFEEGEVEFSMFSFENRGGDFNVNRGRIRENGFHLQWRILFGKL